MAEQTIVDDFHVLYYYSHETTWTNTTWLGVPLQKCPLDLWIYQEILTELKPGLIVETGTWRGGSALYLASVCDLLGQGKVVTIDVQPDPGRPAHPRITYLAGSSTDPTILEQVRDLARGVGPVVVILDSNHSFEHVLCELQAYSPLVTPGSYLIVEDTNINGHPVLPGAGPGPMEAVGALLRKDPGFVVDSSREKFLLTFQPRGYLQRVR